MGAGKDELPVLLGGGFALHGEYLPCGGVTFFF